MISNNQLAELEAANAQRTQGEWVKECLFGSPDLPVELTNENGQKRFLMHEENTATVADVDYFLLAANLVPGLIARLRKTEEALKFYAEVTGLAEIGVNDAEYDLNGMNGRIGKHARDYFASIKEKKMSEANVATITDEQKLFISDENLKELEALCKLDGKTINEFYSAYGVACDLVQVIARLRSAEARLNNINELTTQMDVADEISAHFKSISQKAEGE